MEKRGQPKNSRNEQGDGQKQNEDASEANEPSNWNTPRTASALGRSGTDGGGRWVFSVVFPHREEWWGSGSRAIPALLRWGWVGCAHYWVWEWEQEVGKWNLNVGVCNNKIAMNMKGVNVKKRRGIATELLGDWNFYFTWGFLTGFLMWVIEIQVEDLKIY